MTTELWGTFSVRDHLVERAFVADVLLYDRLVIPTLPEDGDPRNWPPEWNLARQQRLLNVLGELAVALPWTEERHRQWQTRFDHASAKERRLAREEAASCVASDAKAARTDDLPFQVTRMLLADYANAPADDRLFQRLHALGKARPGSELEAVAAYPSFASFNEDVPTTSQNAGRKTLYPPTAVFGWDFFVPQSAETGETEDLRLLETAVELAGRADFIEVRSDFYGWLSDVSRGRIPLAEARIDMEKRVRTYQKLMAGQGWKKWTRRAIKVADAFAGGLGLVNEVAGVVAESFLGTADIVADERLEPKKMVPRTKVAAMFHDARKRFGWKPLDGD